MRENRKTVCKAGKGYGRVERCKKSNNSWQMYRAKEEGGSRGGGTDRQGMDSGVK